MSSSAQVRKGANHVMRWGGRGHGARTMWILQFCLFNCDHFATKR